MLTPRNTLLRYLLPALVLTILSGGVIIAFYVNHPPVEILSDSWSYLYVVDRINTAGQFVDAWRLPCYPLFIAALYAIAGQGNVETVSIAQAVLFVMATIEIYILAACIFQRAWLAFTLSLMVGINLTLISYVKPLMTEGLGLWLLASLTLTVILFMRTLQRRFLWLTAFWMLLLFMTRPEWLYLPPLLFASMLALVHRKQLLRRLLPHTLAALVLIYAIVGGYIYINTIENNFDGMTWITNINLVGKILQYNMQNDGNPSNPQQVTIAHTLDRYVRKGTLDPYSIMYHEPKLFGNNVSVPARYAEYVILHHPKTFILKTAPLFFSSLTAYAQESRVDPTGILGQPLSILHQASYLFYFANGLFPLYVLLWSGLFCFKGIRQNPTIQMIGLLMLICVYDMVLTVTGGYRIYDYMRLYVLMDPLLIVIIWGLLLWGISLFWTKVVRQALSQKKAGKHIRVLLFSSLCLSACILSGCAKELIAPANIHGIDIVSCHREDGVGLLFLRFDNRGASVSSASMQLYFDTAHARQPVIIYIRIPPLPHDQERLIAINEPIHGINYLTPDNSVKVHLILPASDKQPQTNFTMACHDAS